MKLDRNINPDGRGKYALINRRKLDSVDQLEINDKAGQDQYLTLPGIAVEDGREGQFFVIKYKDRFAAAALGAYVSAVRQAAIDAGVSNPGCQQASELHEFANEMYREAEAAAAYPNKQTPD